MISTFIKVDISKTGINNLFTVIDLTGEQNEQIRASDYSK